jgi:hypothetical protein
MSHHLRNLAAALVSLLTLDALVALPAQADAASPVATTVELKRYEATVSRSATGPKGVAEIHVKVLPKETPGRVALMYHRLPVQLGAQGNYTANIDSNGRARLRWNPSETMRLGKYKFVVTLWSRNEATEPFVITVTR